MQLVVSAFYDAKVSFNCSYLIAVSAKNFFKPSQTHRETMFSCFLKESWCKLAPPDTVVLKVGIVSESQERQREKGEIIISMRGHELTPPCWILLMIEILMHQLRKSNSSLSDK